MEIYETQSKIGTRPYWFLSLVSLFLIVLGTMIMLQLLAVGLLPFLFGIPFEDIIKLAAGESVGKHSRMAFLFLQALGSGLGFLLGGWIYVKWVDRADLGWPKQINRVRWGAMLLLIPLIFGFMAFNALVIEWNMGVSFPEFLSGFEKWAAAKEAEMMRITLFFTDFDSFWEFLLGILVIGVLAGIGEEYLFRGILQPKLQTYTGNPHAGIWLSAFIFSAIHLQFYGFFPRLFLGALFGYLYNFSGSLLYAMVAHIINNAFTVTMVYLNKIGWVSFNMGEPERVSWFMVILGILVFGISFRFFDGLHQKKLQT
ncbi:CPBP family intramembrane glutamic endopeptidase [Pararhodonellum marinum]|uniref:CPBP family intramembrane glutamic endopeptidase n=1 Tax=Pararhodonellum marinum TaxID=2755358 RepID=UPI00188FE311|nr:CPBP family intramembrane glutamic endopeptidase [Pararhodonellum marinum]